MEYTGLIQKYPINRPLTDLEAQERLKQGQRLDVVPVYQLSVIRMNSTFLEIADKYYGLKGVLTTAALSAAIVMTIGYLVYAFMLYLSADAAKYSSSDAAFVSVMTTLILAPLLVFVSWLLLKESFAYTHYPVRLNRKTRMVHVFRLDGTVLTVPWEAIYFTLGRCASPKQWDVRGHVLDADGVTVRESFALGAWDVGQQGKAILRRYWEFIRRYMEDGPKEAHSTVAICLPIAERRESVRSGYDRMFAEFSGAPFMARALGAVMALAMVPGRWFAIRTSKIPRWPESIEDESRVEAGDPYARDSRDNPQV
jgi:hypothetical protein